MRNLNDEIFPQDEAWLHGAFQNTDELFKSFEYFSNYIKKRFPNSYDEHMENYRGTFLIEKIDVIFVDPKKTPRPMLTICFADCKILIEYPASKHLSKKEQDEIREQYLFKFAPIVKESHVRAMTLLWKLLGEQERATIIKSLKTQTKAKK